MAHRACSDFPERRLAAHVQVLDDSVYCHRLLCLHRVDRDIQSLDAISEVPEVPFFWPSV